VIGVRVRQKQVPDCLLPVQPAVKPEAAGVDGHALVDEITAEILARSAIQSGGTQDDNLHRRASGMTDLIDTRRLPMAWMACCIARFLG
jgi:hypothetical protein